MLLLGLAVLVLASENVAAESRIHTRKLLDSSDKSSGDSNGYITSEVYDSSADKFCVEDCKVWCKQELGSSYKSYHVYKYCDADVRYSKAIDTDSCDESDDLVCCCATK